MLQPTIRQLIRRVEQLEDTFDSPEIEQLEVWSKLIRWFAWVRRCDDDWMAEFERLPLDDPVRELYGSLLWGFRYFVGRIPDRLKTGDWITKSKILIEYFITTLLGEMSPAELSQQQHFDGCILWTIEQLRDTELWAEYDEQFRQKRLEAEAEAERKRREYQEFVKAHEAAPVIKHEPVTIQPTESAGPDVGEVTSNGVVRIKYVGGSVGFNILTITGPEPAIKGRQYIVTTEVWQNLQEFSIGRWEKIQ